MSAIFYDFAGKRQRAKVLVDPLDAVASVFYRCLDLTTILGLLDVSSPNTIILCLYLVGRSIGGRRTAG